MNELFACQKKKSSEAGEPYVTVAYVLTLRSYQDAASLGFFIPRSVPNLGLW